MSTSLLKFLLETIEFSSKGGHILDPTCDNGIILSALTGGETVTGWGISPDPDKTDGQSRIIRGTVFDARINPLECMGLLILNPPENEAGGYLKHATKWLAPEGVLIFITPKSYFADKRARQWLEARFKQINIYSLSHYMAILLGVKKKDKDDTESRLPEPPYADYAVAEKTVYPVPYTQGPKIFQGEDIVTPEDVTKHTPEVMKTLFKIGILKENTDNAIRPLFPLRKGHIVSILTSGALNGLIETPDGFLIIKGFTDREKITEKTRDGETEKDIYRVGIRVMGPEGWYDVQ